MFRGFKIAAVACAVLALPTTAWPQPATEDPSPCAAPPPVPKKKAKEVRDATAYFLLAGALGAAMDEADKTERDTSPPAAAEPETEPAPQTPECLLETFDADGATIRAFHTPGASAADRQYRFSLGGAGGERTISALPEPLLAILLKEGDYVALMETVGNETRIYRVLRNEPSYDMLKAMVLDIRRGAIGPVIGLGRKDDGGSSMNVYDLDRLSR